MSGQRQNVPSWDQTFMNIAEVVSKRSKDPRTQVGACIVSSDNRILSLGYNGTPRGFSDDDFPWNREADNPLDTKYPYVVHSERNAILNFRGLLREFEGATLFVTFFPCNECAKEIAQTGIAEVVYRNDYDLADSSKASLRIFEAANITVRKL